MALLMFLVGIQGRLKVTANVQSVEVIVGHQILKEDLDRLKATIGTTRTQKPIAFIFGDELWSNLDTPKSLIWLDSILGTIKHQLPHLTEPNALWPRLFVTSNTEGEQKENEWFLTQDKKALMLYEEAMKFELERRGLEHLGT